MKKQVKNFKVLLDKNNSYAKNINEMTERYLTKLFPLQRRIYMDLEDDFFGKKLEIRESHDDKTGEQLGTVRNAIPELIYEKTRYVFYNTLGTMSLIVPRNLRALRMLVAMLYKMPKCDIPYIDTDDNEKTKQRGNKEKFRHYLFETYTESFPNEYKNITSNLIAEKDLSQLNKETVSLLKGQDLIKTSEDSIMKQITDANNATYNVSLADCFYVLDNIEKTIYDLDTKKLIFFIKTLYSVRLYDCYCSMIDGEDKEDGNEFTTDYGNLSGINRIQQLVGGAYFTLEGDTLIPKENGKKPREKRLINGNTVDDAIKKIVDDYNSGDHNDTIKNIDIKKLRTLEFIMLTTSRYLESKEKGDDINRNNYRTKTDVYYDRELSDVKNMVFDISSIFFNILDVERCYNRFNELIFEIAKNREGSLYRLLLEQMPKPSDVEKTRWEIAKEVEYEDDQNKIYNDRMVHFLYMRLLSNICIRNSELVKIIIHNDEKQEKK